MRYKDVSKRDEWPKQQSLLHSEKKQRALIKFKTADKIDTAARKKTIAGSKKVLSQYSEMSLQQRAIVDQGSYRSTARK